MIALQDQPTLSDLYTLIERVRSYPVSAANLIDLARNAGLPRPVIEFYRAFPSAEIFINKEDLLARTEQLEIMHREEPPAEILTSAEED